MVAAFMCVVLSISSGIWSGMALKSGIGMFDSSSNKADRCLYAFQAISIVCPYGVSKHFFVSGLAFRERTVTLPYEIRLIDDLFPAVTDGSSDTPLRVPTFVFYLSKMPLIP